jgi:hypothetical protein
MDLSLAVYPIDTGLDSVEWSSKGLKMLWRAPMLPEGIGAVHCHVDVCRARVQSEESGEYGREIAERMRRLMTPEMLDRFHDVLCTAKYLYRERLKFAGFLAQQAEV